MARSSPGCASFLKEREIFPRSHPAKASFISLLELDHVPAYPLKKIPKNEQDGIWLGTLSSNQNGWEKLEKCVW